MSEFNRIGRKVAEDFLQNVVFYDDYASLEGTDPSETEVANKLSASPQLGGLDTTSDLDSAPERELSQGGASPDAGLNAKVVTDEFAKFGLICTVLRPNESDQGDDSYLKECVLKATSSADIVVLDWRIGESVNGEVTLDVVGKIVKRDLMNNRLRLIVIYTSEHRLDVISSDLTEVLDSIDPNPPTGQCDVMRLVKGPVTVVILAKDSARSYVVDPYKDQVVDERVLPDRLIEEYSKMTQGLLRNLALAGLTALREEAHKILGQFDTSLDPAYLGHRALQAHPSDAEDHIVDALGSELLSVLEERRIGAKAGVTSIRHWLSKRVTEGLDIQNPILLSKSCNYFDTWMELMESGNGRGESRLLTKSEWAKLEDSSTDVFSDDGTKATESNLHFARLLGLKTRYSGGRTPSLTLGTILESKVNGASEYWLCLQPKCDSVRLKEKTGFPLLPLVQTSKEGGDPKFKIVIEKHPSDWIYLTYSPKPANLKMPTFQPWGYPPGEVFAIKRSDGPYFKDVNGTKYAWIAEMKDQQALKVAGEVANALARPGFNESEWLRLAASS